MLEHYHSDLQMDHSSRQQGEENHLNLEIYMDEVGLGLCVGWETK